MTAATPTDEERRRLRPSLGHATLERFWKAVAWTDYIPHEPTPKQLAFLMLPHREAFYGGAAGGGKSDALLMAALQYVNVPRYSAIIFRKSLTDLELEEALIPRSHLWLGDTDAHWNGSLHKWTFPSGAVLQFGYMKGPLDRFRYQSAAFQYVGFDEASQFWEDEFLYMFSRLRRGRCPNHIEDPPDPKCRSCCEFSAQFKIPLRVRLASNPGGVGHGWLQNRYKIKRVGPIYRGTDPSRPHIPAFIKDNPYLDQQTYIESLQNLDPVTREQLLRGDWGVSPDSRFRRSWARYYEPNETGDYIFSDDGKGYYLERCLKFQTADVAASIREGPADTLIWRREPSWTVIATWIITSDWRLLLYDVDRFQSEIPEVLQRIRTAFRKHNRPTHRVMFSGVEANGLGIGVFQQLLAEGFPMKDLKPRSVDKLVRATDAANRMEQGRIFFPREAPWLETYLQEVFTWTGDPMQTSDQIDVTAYAAICTSEIAATIGHAAFGRSDEEHVPSVIGN